MASINPNTRIKIYERDGYMCLRCGAKDNLTIDHVIPSCKGGANNLSNYQTLCSFCNCMKGSNSTDYRWITAKGTFNKPVRKLKKKVEQISITDIPKREKYIAKHPSNIVHNGITCKLFGTLTKSIHTGIKEGHPVYHDRDNSKLVIEYFGTTMAWSYDTLYPFVNLVEIEKIQPDNINPIKEMSLSKFREWVVNEPECNFHETA